MYLDCSPSSRPIKIPSKNVIPLLKFEEKSHFFQLFLRTESVIYSLEYYDYYLLLAYTGTLEKFYVAEV